MSGYNAGPERVRKLRKEAVRGLDRNRRFNFFLWTPKTMRYKIGFAKKQRVVICLSVNKLGFDLASYTPPRSTR